MEKLDMILDEVKKSGEVVTKMKADVEDMEKKTAEKIAEIETKTAEALKNATNVNLEKGDSKDYESLEMFIKDAMFTKSDKVAKYAEKVKALGEGGGATGGYLVPDEFRNELLKLATETAIVRGNGAKVITMTRQAIKIPVLKSTNNTKGNMYGGILAYWTAEAAEIASSQPTFSELELVANKLAGYTESSMELNDDSATSIGSLLSQAFADVLSYEEDEAFIRGDGVKKPLGILNANCTIQVDRTTASHIVLDDFINLYARKLNRGGGRYVWLANQEALPDILKLKDENDNLVLVPGFTGNVSQEVPGTIYGIPLFITEKASALGSLGDLMLCNFSHYLIGDRKAITIEMSSDFKFSSDTIAMKIVERVDGQPWLDAAVTPRNGTKTLSPFVVLK